MIKDLDGKKMTTKQWARKYIDIEIDYAIECWADRSGGQYEEMTERERAEVQRHLENLYRAMAKHCRLTFIHGDS